MTPRAPERKHPLDRLVQDDRGEDLIEYALLVAFAAGVVLVGLLSDTTGVKGALVAVFQKVRTALDSVL